MLVDYKAFWRYDNRESLASQQAQQQAQQPKPSRQSMPQAPSFNFASSSGLEDEINDALA